MRLLSKRFLHFGSSIRDVESLGSRSAVPWSLRVRIRVTIKFAIIAYCLVSVAKAEQAPSFPEVVREAERSSPRLRELEADVDAAQGRARQATAWANPTLGADFENFAGGSGSRAAAQPQTTLSISEPLELGGQRSARVAAGRAELTAAQARRIHQRAYFGSQLALAYAT